MKGPLKSANLRPRTRVEAVESIEILTANAREFARLSERSTCSETRRLGFGMVARLGAERVQIARRWGLIGFAMSLCGAGESQINLVLAQEG